MKEMNRKRRKELSNEYDKLKKDLSSLKKDILADIKKLMRLNRIQYQEIESRIKKKESVINKMLKKDLHIKKVIDMQDLVGVKLIFYVTHELERAKRVIISNYGIKDIEKKEKESSYEAWHLILDVPEKYKNIKKCEIQLQTSLYNTLNSISHPVIYKDNYDLSISYKNEFNIIKQSFNKIMKEYLKNAQGELDNVYLRIGELKIGKNLFSSDYFKKIMLSKNLNEIYSSLILLETKLNKSTKYILDDINLSNFIDKLLMNCLDLKPIRIYEKILGYTFEDVFFKSLDIMLKLKYVYKKKAISLYFKYLECNLHESNKIEEYAKNLARFQRSNQANSINQSIQLQEIIVDYISGFSDALLIKHSRIILVMLRKVLSLYFDQYEQTEKQSVQFFWYSIPKSNKIVENRRKSIEILLRIINLCENQTDKINVLKELKYSVHIPSHIQMVEEKINGYRYLTFIQIIKLYNCLLKSKNYITLLYILNELKRVQKIIEDNRIKRKISIIIEKLSINSEVQILDVLIKSDYSRLRNDREKGLADINIIVENLEYAEINIWERRIEIIDQTFKREEFYKLEKYLYFLCLLAEKKPKIAKKIIDDIGKIISISLVHLLKGLFKTNETVFVNRIINGRLRSRAQLELIIEFYYVSQQYNERVYRRIYTFAVNNNDYDLLDRILYNLVRIEIKKDSQLLMFKKLVIKLMKSKRFDIIKNIAYNAKEYFDKYIEEDWESLLNNFIEVDNVTDSYSYIFNILIEKYPKLFVKLFINRIKLNKQKNLLSYTPVPFDLDLDKHISSTKVNQALNLIFQYANVKNELRRMYLAELVKIIVPEMNSNLNKRLKLLWNSKNERNNKFANIIKSVYMNDTEIYDIDDNE